MSTENDRHGTDNTRPTQNPRSEGTRPMPSAETPGCPAGAGRRSFVRTALGAGAAGAVLAGGAFALAETGGTAQAQAEDTTNAAETPSTAPTRPASSPPPRPPRPSSPST